MIPNNDPLYNTKDSRVQRFAPFVDNIKKEKDDLKKVKRQNRDDKVSRESFPHSGQDEMHWNTVTNKMDNNLSKSQIEDRIKALEDDGVDQPYKTPYQLQKAGVLFAINDEDGQHRGKNLPFNAGTAVAYGLTKEEALSAITLNAAKILGIADKTGSIEVGKDANIVISDGDILDMRSNKISNVLIQGRMVDLTDKHKQLYERYKSKYEIK